jgi:hypothetical protein
VTQTLSLRYESPEAGALHGLTWLFVCLSVHLPRWVNCQQMAADACAAVRDGRLTIIPQEAEAIWFRWGTICPSDMRVSKVPRCFSACAHVSRPFQTMPRIATVASVCLLINLHSCACLFFLLHFPFFQWL